MTGPSNAKEWLVRLGKGPDAKYADENGGWTTNRCAARKFATYGASNYINAVAKREGVPKHELYKEPLHLAPPRIVPHGVSYQLHDQARDLYRGDLVIASHWGTSNYHIVVLRSRPDKRFGRDERVWSAASYCEADPLYYWRPETDGKSQPTCKRCIQKWRVLGMPSVRGMPDDSPDEPVEGIDLPLAWREVKPVGLPADEKPEDVDDAIASRCIARLSYGPPGPEAQARIWRNLARINGIQMSDRDIAAVCKAHPTLSGRDVKNLLKLASFVAEGDGKPVTVKTIEFALQFKPTQSVERLAQARVDDTTGWTPSDPNEGTDEDGEDDD